MLRLWDMLCTTLETVAGVRVLQGGITGAQLQQSLEVQAAFAAQLVLPMIVKPEPGWSLTPHTAALRRLAHVWLGGGHTGDTKQQ